MTHQEGPIRRQDQKMLRCRYEGPCLIWIATSVTEPSCKHLQKYALSTTTFTSNHWSAKPHGWYCLTQLIQLPNQDGRSQSAVWVQAIFGFREIRIERKPWNFVSVSTVWFQLTAMGIWEEGTYRVKDFFHFKSEIVKVISGTLSPLGWGLMMTKTGRGRQLGGGRCFSRSSRDRYRMVPNIKVFAWKVL